MAASAEIIPFPLPEKPELILKLRYSLKRGDRTFYFLSALWKSHESFVWDNLIHDNKRLEGVLPGNNLALYAVGAK